MRNALYAAFVAVSAFTMIACKAENCDKPKCEPKIEKDCDKGKCKAKDKCDCGDKCDCCGGCCKGK